MPDLPPYVQVTEHMQVHAVVRGTRHDAVVLGRRGDRVYLTWKSTLGNHLGWVPAADIRRCNVHPVDDRRKTSLNMCATNQSSRCPCRAGHEHKVPVRGYAGGGLVSDRPVRRGQIDSR